MSGVSKKFSNFKSAVKDVQEKGAQSIYKEREKLVRNYETLKSELITYQNNLGFLTASSKKGNSLLDELNKKVEKLKEDIKEAEKKIREMDKTIQEQQGDQE
jgi:chromosome segregation ATPase